MTDEFDYRQLPIGLEQFLKDGTIESVVTKNKRKWVFDPQLNLMKSKKETSK